MSDCAHENFDAAVDVVRISDDGTGEDIIHFIASVRIRCVDCGEPFGFRGPPGGHSWDEPRCDVSALTIQLPLMSPAELVLAGPLPTLSRGPMVIDVHPRSS
jgi:hypothetical protein